MKNKDKFKIYKQPDAYAVYNGRSKDKTDTLWDLSDKIDKVYERQTDRPLLDLLPDKLKKNRIINRLAFILISNIFNL